MNIELLKHAGQLSGVAGVASLAIATFLYVARDLIAKQIFPTLARERAYRILFAVAFFAWSIAMAGIAAWTLVEMSKRQPAKTPGPPVQVVAEELRKASERRDAFKDSPIRKVLPDRYASAIGLVDSGREALDDGDTHAAREFLAAANVNFDELWRTEQKIKESIRSSEFWISDMRRRLTTCADVQPKGTELLAEASREWVAALKAASDGDLKTFDERYKHTQALLNAVRPHTVPRC